MDNVNVAPYNTCALSRECHASTLERSFMEVLPHDHLTYDRCISQIRIDDIHCDSLYPVPDV